MDNRELAVRVDHDGRVCTLTFAGALDVIAARGAVAQVAEAVHGLVEAGPCHAEQVGLDLSGLTFLDCAGARAVASVAEAVPAEYPVVVPAISPAAARLLDLLGLTLEHGPAAAMPEHRQDRAWQLRRAHAVRSSARQTRDQLADVAAAVAWTEDRVAATMARMARQHPGQAARLIRLSEQASSYAAQIRHHMDDRARRAQRIPVGKAAGGG